MNPRGRLRRRRRKQTNDFRTDPIGSQKWSISALNDGRDPIFSTIFSRTCDRSSIECSVIFLVASNKQTDDGQDLGPIGASRSPVFDLENGSTPASSPKKWVRIRPINSLKKLFKEHLRHTHSFALFRNCACGAMRNVHF